jgi:hypothetical protein
MNLEKSIEGQFHIAIIDHRLLRTDTRRSGVWANNSSRSLAPQGIQGFWASSISFFLHVTARPPELCMGGAEQRCDVLGQLASGPGPLSDPYNEASAFSATGSDASTSMDASRSSHANSSVVPITWIDAASFVTFFLPYNYHSVTFYLVLILCDKIWKFSELVF